MSELEIKPREAWIDISRFVAACLIVCVHVPNFSFAAMFRYPVFNGRVMFFLILAGYFFGRNNSWQKSYKRAVSLLMPFLIWNVIISLFTPGLTELTCKEYLSRLVGIPGEPFSTPTWFLRDIIILSLLSPILLKIRILGYAFVLLVFCSNILTFPMPNRIPCAPVTTASFCIGLYISGIDLKKIRALYRPCLTPYIYVSILVGCLLGVYSYLYSISVHPEWPVYQHWEKMGVLNFHYEKILMYPVFYVFGAVLLMFIGMHIEEKCPGLKKLSQYAPACFLIFVLHYPLINLIPTHVWKSSLLMPCLLVPVIIAVIVSFYLILRRFFPACLPYMANDRISKNILKNNAEKR